MGRYPLHVDENPEASGVIVQLLPCFWRSTLATAKPCSQKTGSFWQQPNFAAAPRGRSPSAAKQRAALIRSSRRAQPGPFDSHELINGKYVYEAPSPWPF